MVPFPSWPTSFTPQQSTPPEANTAQVLPSSSLARLRTGTSGLTGPNPATALGIGLHPDEANPQQSTRPEVSRAQTFPPWSPSPATRLAMPPSRPFPVVPTTVTGTLLIKPATDGLPSALSPSNPQQSARPEVRSAQLVGPGTPVTLATAPSAP